MEESRANDSAHEDEVDEIQAEKLSRMELMSRMGSQPTWDDVAVPGEEILPELPKPKDTTPEGQKDTLKEDEQIEKQQIDNSETWSEFENKEENLSNRYDCQESYEYNEACEYDTSYGYNDTTYAYGAGYEYDGSYEYGASYEMNPRRNGKVPNNLSNSECHNPRMPYRTPQHLAHVNYWANNPQHRMMRMPPRFDPHMSIGHPPPLRPPILPFQDPRSLLNANPVVAGITANPGSNPNSVAQTPQIQNVLNQASLMRQIPNSTQQNLKANAYSTYGLNYHDSLFNAGSSLPAMPSAPGTAEGELESFAVEPESLGSKDKAYSPDDPTLDETISSNPANTTHSTQLNENTSVVCVSDIPTPQMPEQLVKPPELTVAVNSETANVANNPKIPKPVLGKAQAKKRLMAFANKFGVIPKILITKPKPKPDMIGSKGDGSSKSSSNDSTKGKMEKAKGKPKDKVKSLIDELNDAKLKIESAIEAQQQRLGGSSKSKKYEDRVPAIEEIVREESMGKVLLEYHASPSNTEKGDTSGQGNSNGRGKWKKNRNNHSDDDEESKAESGRKSSERRRRRSNDRDRDYKSRDDSETIDRRSVDRDQRRRDRDRNDRDRYDRDGRRRYTSSKDKEKKDGQSPSANNSSRGRDKEREMEKLRNWSDFKKARLSIGETTSSRQKDRLTKNRTAQDFTKHFDQMLMNGDYHLKRYPLIVEGQDGPKQFHPESVKATKRGRGPPILYSENPEISLMLNRQQIYNAVTSERGDKMRQICEASEIQIITLDELEIKKSRNWFKKMTDWKSMWQLDSETQVIAVDSNSKWSSDSGVVPNPENFESAIESSEVEQQAIIQRTEKNIDQINSTKLLFDTEIDANARITNESRLQSGDQILVEELQEKEVTAPIYEPEPDPEPTELNQRRSADVSPIDKSVGDQKLVSEYEQFMKMVSNDPAAATISSPRVDSTSRLSGYEDSSLKNLTTTGSLEFGKTDEVVLNDETENSFVASVNLPDKNKSGPSNDCSGSDQVSSENEIEDGTSRDESENSQLVPSDWKNVKIKEERMSDESFEIQNKKEKRKKKSSSTESLESSSSSSSSSASSSSSPSSSSSSSSFSSSTSSSSSSSSSSDSSSKTRRKMRKNRKKKKRKGKPTKRKNKKKAVSSSSESESSENESSDFSSEEERKLKNKRKKKLKKKGKRVVVKRKRKRRKSTASWTSSDSEKSEKQKKKRQIGEKSIREKHADDQSSESNDSMSEGLTVESKKLTKDKSHDEKQDSSSAAKIALSTREVKEEKMDVEPQQASKKSSLDDKQIGESRNYAEVWDYEEESSRQKNDESRQIAGFSGAVDSSSQSIAKEETEKEEQRKEKFLEAWEEEGLKISQQIMQKAEAETNNPHLRTSRIEADKLSDVSNKAKIGVKHVKEDRLIQEWERENERSLQQIPPDEESSKESSGRRPKRKGKRSSSEWEDCDFQLSTNLHSPAFALLEKTNKKKMLLMDEWEVDSLEGAKEPDLCRKRMKNEKMTEKEVKYDKETDTYIAVQREAAREHRKKKNRPSAIRIWEDEEEEGEKEAMLLVQERSKRQKNRKSDSWSSLDTENLKVVTNDSWENEISEDALWKERDRNSAEKRMDEEPDNQCFKNYYDDSLNSDHKETTSTSRQEKVRSNSLIGDWAPKEDESSSNKSSSNNTEKSSDSASCMPDDVRKVENGKARKKKGRTSWELRNNEKTSDWEELDEKEKRKIANENSSQDIANLWKTEQLCYNSSERDQDLAPKPIENIIVIDESSWKDKDRREPKKNRRSRWDVEDSFSQYKDKKNESDNLLLIEWEEEHNEWVKNSTTVLENFSVKSAAYDDSLARSTSTHHDTQFETKRVNEIPRKSEKSEAPFTSFESTAEHSTPLEMDPVGKKSWSIDDASASSHNSLSSMIELNFKTKRITPVVDKECANLTPKLKCQHKSDFSKPSHEVKSRADLYISDSPVFSQKSEEMDISSESQAEPSKDSISVSNIPLPSDELSVVSVHQLADIPISLTPVCHSSVTDIVVKPQLRVAPLRDESKEISESRDSPKVEYEATRPVTKKRVCKWDVEDVPVKKSHLQVEEPPSNVGLETSFERKPSKLDIFADYESDSESEDLSRSESSENFRNDRGSGVIRDEVKSPLKLIPKQILTHASTTKHVSESHATEIAQGTISFKIPKKILQNHALQGSDEAEDAEFENLTAVNVSLIENSERKSGNRHVIPKEVGGAIERDKHDIEAEKIAISECRLPCPVETTEKEMKTNDTGVRDDGYTDVVHKREDDRLSRHSRSRSRSRDRRKKSPEKRERDRWSRDDRRRSRGSESRDKTGKQERSSEVQDSRSRSSAKYCDKRRGSPTKGRGSSGKRNRSRSPTSNKRLADRSRSRSPASRRDRDRSPRRRFCETDAERDRNARSSERSDNRDVKDSMREDDTSAKDSKRSMKSPVRYPLATSGEDKRFANVDGKPDKTRERGRYRESMEREREKSYDPMEIFREKSLEMERNRKRLHAEDENRKLRWKGDDDTDVQNEGNQYDKSNEDYDHGFEGRRARREDSYDRERDGGQTRMSTVPGAKYRSRERSIESGANRDRGRGWDRESPSSEKRQSRSSYSRSRSPPPRHASRTSSDRYRSTRRSRSKSRSPDRSSWSADRLHRSRSSTRSPSENRMTGRRIETIVQTVTTVTGITGVRRDSAITEAEMVAGNDCVSHDSTHRYPNNGEINDDEYYYYSGGNLTYPPRIEEAQPRSATIGSGSPKRLSLDDRLELELGIKKKHQQISLAVQDSQPLAYHPAAFSTNMATYPAPPPTMIPGIPPVAYQATTPSQTPKVLQVGNVLQVIPSEFTAVSPPQRELSAVSNSSHVVRVGNVLQVVPTTMDWTAAPPIADPVSGIYRRPCPPTPSTPVGVPPPSPALSLVCAASTTPPVVLPRPEVAPVIQPVYNYDAILEERKRQREERKMAREERRKEKELKKIEKMKRRADRLMKKNLTLRQQEGATFQHQHNPLPGEPSSTGMEDEDVTEAVSLETENIDDDEQNQISQQKQDAEETTGGLDEESAKEKPELVPLPPPPAKGILISPGFGRSTANGEPKYPFDANESDDEGRRTRDDNVDNTSHTDQLPCDDSVENLVKVLNDESTTKDISEADPRRRRRIPRRRDRKSVQFADGVRPGEGTSPSGGEGDMPSPPPPVTAALLPLRPSNIINHDVLPGSEKRIKLKKSKKRPHKSKPPKTKKKVKVKIIKLKKSRSTTPASLPIDDPEEGYERSPPPPPPGSPPPPHLWPSYLAAYNAATHPTSSPLAIVEESPTVPAPPPPTPLPLLVPPPPLNYTIQPCNKT